MLTNLILRKFFGLTHSFVCFNCPASYDQKSVTRNCDDDGLLSYVLKEVATG